MKATYIKLLFFIFVLTSLEASGQKVMVVEKHDNTTVKVGLNDIKRIYFEAMDYESAYDTLNTIYNSIKNIKNLSISLNTLCKTVQCFCTHKNCNKTPQ